MPRSSLTRPISGWPTGQGITEKVICHIVRRYRTGRGELEQAEFLLGHMSVETTEHNLGCKQRLRNAVNDRIGLEP